MFKLIKLEWRKNNILKYMAGLKCLYNNILKHK